MRVTVRGHSYELTILECKTRIPHVPSKQELADAARNSWLRIPDYDYVPSGGLELRLPHHWDGRRHRWSDGKRWRLEDKLAQVLAEVEERAERDEQRRLEAERQAEQHRRAHQQALQRARERLVEAHRAEVLADQIKAWQLADDIRSFCAAIRARLLPQPAEHDHHDHVEDEVDLDDISAWLAWAEAYADQIDPVRHPTGMPDDPEPTPEVDFPRLAGHLR